MKMNTTIRKTTYTQKKGYITGEDIRQAFDLPDHAEVYFQVPGGGDWCNESIDITRDDPIYVVWDEVTEEET